VALLNVRRLAAIDMHGLSGSDQRKKIIEAEFWVGALGCLALGIASLALGHGLGRLLGAWLIGVGLNYLPLALSARSLSKPGALDAELDGVDIRAEAPKFGVRQLLIIVPLAVVFCALTARPENG
jgi:hypothetical protein